MATNAQLEARIKALETKVKALEARPTGGTVDLAPLTARVTALESLTCPQESRIAAIESKAVSEATAQDVLETDHVPSV